MWSIVGFYTTRPGEEPGRIGIAVRIGVENLNDFLSFPLIIELVFGRLAGMGTGGGAEQLQGLREAIEGLDLAVHGDVIAEARELADRLDAVICAAEAAYTAAGLAEVEGFANTASFARHRCAMSLPRSRRVARRAARVAAWPELGAAWSAGRLTGDQVELICATVPERHLERFAQTIDETIAVLSPLSAFQTGKVLRHWVNAADDAAQREAAEAGEHLVSPAPQRELAASRVGDELAVRGFSTPTPRHRSRRRWRPRNETISRVSGAPRSNDGPTPSSQSVRAIWRRWRTPTGTGAANGSPSTPT